MNRVVVRLDGIGNVPADDDLPSDPRIEMNAGRQDGSSREVGLDGVRRASAPVEGT